MNPIDKNKERWPARYARYAPPGRWPVQLRFDSGYTSEQYINRQAWRSASLTRCPNHPHGGCSLARHGTYGRKTPAGVQVARWYCPESHTTFSLLPDCLASRLPGTLSDLEHVVAVAEASPSLAAAANVLRTDAIELPGALRWVRRRIALVHRCLLLLIGLLPDHLAGCPPEINACRGRLGSSAVLILLRQLAAPQLTTLASPLGFYPHWTVPGDPDSAHQQQTGPDPPVGQG